MADNASITILRNTQANINAEPIKDGNILFTTDQAENKIYADVGTTRIKIGGTVDVDTTLSTTSTNPVQNKVITSKFQNLQIGGRNLIKDSEGELSGEYPNSGYTSLGARFVNLPAYATQFVLSFEAKSTVAGDIISSYFYNPSNITKTEGSNGFISYADDGGINYTLTTNWTRYWVKWTAPVAEIRTVLPCRLVAGKGTGTVSIRNIKFETGNIPTDWTPSLEDMFDVIRPVGSLYSTTDANFDPNTAKGWHGTWERIKDCVIYASGDSDTVGSIVGSNTHTLTEAELPSHRHSIPSLSGTAKSHGIGGMYTALSSTNFGVGFLNGGPSLSNYWPYNGGESNSRHEHDVETNASNTDYAGSGTAIDMRTRRLNSVVWRRTA